MNKPNISKASLTVAAAASVAALPGLALAHHPMGYELPQTFAQGFLSGLGHPVIGLDHAVFILAAGFMLATAKRGYLGIGALILGTLFGAGLHLSGVSISWADAAVALSVLAAGALIVTKRGIRLPWLAGGLMLAGVFHGFAYAESILGAEPTPLAAYLAGFSVVQLGIASLAYLAHHRLMRGGTEAARPLTNAFGAALGASGLIFLLGTIA
jgi:urease accessory protein